MQSRNEKTVFIYSRKTEDKMKEKAPFMIAKKKKIKYTDINKVNKKSTCGNTTIFLKDTKQT